MFMKFVEFNLIEMWGWQLDKVGVEIVSVYTRVRKSEKYHKVQF